MTSTQKPSLAAISDMPTQQIPIKSQTSAAGRSQRSAPLRGWMLAPQRLFLGATFLYAGIQKLTDPQFFHKSTPGYIGNQLIGFAQASPLHFFLVKIALPHAVLFGWTVALGEIAIGLGTLFGLFFRPATFFGMLLSILFFLTASWSVYPYFYGADIVFAFCWLTLLLTGPAGTGLPAFDAWLQRLLFPQGLEKQGLLIRFLAVVVLGTNVLRVPEPASQPRGSQQQRFSIAQQQREKRRAFLRGLAAGGVSILGATVLGSVLHVFSRPTTGRAATSGGAASTSGGSAAGTTIAQVSAIPENSAFAFTIPTTGDPGLLIHLQNKQFVAFDAICTHAGCEVGYDPGSGHLVCPCHGAQYDPTNQAAVLTGPAPLPLTSVPIHVDNTTGAITLE